MRKWGVPIRGVALVPTNNLRGLVMEKRNREKRVEEVKRETMNKHDIIQRTRD